MIQKLLIISHGNTVPFMTRIEVTKGKPLCHRTSADADQHGQRLIMNRLRPAVRSGFGFVVDGGAQLIQFDRNLAVSGTLRLSGQTAGGQPFLLGLE